jgi:hypothetical protein
MKAGTSGLATAFLPLTCRICGFMKGGTTYLECLYVEYIVWQSGWLEIHERLQVEGANQRPIIPQRGVNAEPPQDMYFKGALFLNTLRSVVDDDKRWFSIIREFYQHFKYQNIMTEDVAAFFNRATGSNLTPVFESVPSPHSVAGVGAEVWGCPGFVSMGVDEKGFVMPVKVGSKGSWQTIQPNDRIGRR